MKKARFFWGILFCTLGCLLWNHAMTQTFGKMEGWVLDDGGNPLPGANVMIEGTRIGATTDTDGHYVILPIDPGVYNVVASMVGYHSVTRTGVRIQSGSTTELNIRLTEAALEMAEMVVVAERPLVEIDRTASRYMVGADEIEQLPLARTTSDIISLQPGVSLDGAYRIRGGNVPTEGRGKGSGGDVAMYVDGIRIVTSDGAFQAQQGQGGSAYWMAANRSAVQEISVVTGGMNAEYGNAQGGVVSIVTQGGGQRYHGWTEYRNIPAGQKHWGANVYEAPMHRDRMKWGNSEWETERDPVTGRLVHQREDYASVTGHIVEANVSGPFRRDKVSFVATGRTDRTASTFPAATQWGRQSGLGNFSSSGNLTFFLKDNIKARVGGLWQRSHEHIDWTNRTAAGVVRGIGDSGKNIFLPADWTASGYQTSGDYLHYLAITHSLSPRTFYDLRISRFTTRTDTTGVPERTTDVRTDQDRWFAIDRQVVQYMLSERNRWQIKFDLTSQVTRGHMFKLGTEMIKYNMWLLRYTEPTPQARHLQYAGARGGPDDPVRPLHMAFYAQDKMEFEGMVINAGLRLDWFDPVTEMPAQSAYMNSTMYNSPLRYQNAPMKRPKISRNLSPRFGVSHPITANATIHFFSGMFLAYPDIYYLFAANWSTSVPDVDWNNNGIIDSHEKYNAMRPGDVGGAVWDNFGHVDVRPEKTISFEVGTDWNFVSNYVLGTTIYYKSARDQYHYHSDQRFQNPRGAGGVYSRVLRNNGFEEQRGIELSLRKAFSHNFSFSLSYNMTWAQQAWGNYDAWFTFFYPDSTYVAAGRFWLNYQVVDGREVPVPLTQAEIIEIGANANRRVEAANRLHGLPGGQGYEQSRMTAREYGVTTADDVELDHLHVHARGYYTGLQPDAGDIRNMASLQVLYATPGDFGPNVNLFGSKLLGNLRANLIWRMQTTGTYYYSPPGQGRQLRDRPIRTWTDLAIDKRFPIGRRGADVSLFLEVRNLFNQQDDSSYNTDDYTNWGLQTPRLDDADYRNYGDMGDRSYYYAPRRLELGVRASF